MKTFHFNLQKILELRKHHEKETELELAHVIGSLIDLEQQLDSLTEERLKTMDRFSAGCEAAEIMVYDRYFQRLKGTQKSLEKDIKTQEQAVEKAREQYRSAARDRKILSNVRETKEQEHKKIQLNEETKMLDDLVRRSP
ncbi:MAG: flagellar export protein FliJ [Treponema sp.]|jgi:flagellar FliJ protein|nr:flagellar export protein FliJ [Treponema sp.]